MAGELIRLVHRAKQGWDQTKVNVTIVLLCTPYHMHRRWNSTPSHLGQLCWHLTFVIHPYHFFAKHHLHMQLFSNSAKLTGGAPRLHNFTPDAPYTTSLHL